MKTSNDWLLAKYEPASKVGSYSWDYKFNNEIKGANLVNRYLIKNNSLSVFLSGSHYYFYVVAPVKGFTRVRKLLCQKRLKTNKFKAVNYSYIDDEKTYDYPVSEETRTITYYYKPLIKYENDQFSLDLLHSERDAVILFSKEALSEGVIVDYLKEEEVQLWRNKDEMLTHLQEANIGLLYKHHYFFHEETTYQPQQEEAVFICYAPWLLA